MEGVIYGQSKRKNYYINIELPIAKEWNAKDHNSPYVGFATSFEVDESYVYKFEEKVVGVSNLQGSHNKYLRW